MKKVILLLVSFCILSSCDEKLTEPESMILDIQKHILEGYFVKCIAFDHQGNAWIGTFMQGLIKYNPSETVVYNSKNSILPDSAAIYDIAVDSQNNIWIGANGLIKFDGEDFTAYNTSNSALPEDFVSAIAIDAQDHLWISSSRFRQGGLVFFDGNEFTVFTPEDSDLPLNMVTSIAIDQDNSVWLALTETISNSYLVKIQNDEWSVYGEEKMGIAPYFFGNIRINSENKVCASINYSLSSLAINPGPQVLVFDGQNSEYYQYDSISDIISLTVDHADNIWCISYDGYALYNGESWTIDHDSFNEESIFTLEEAPDNRIWIGTGNGIYLSK